MPGWLLEQHPPVEKNIQFSLHLLVFHSEQWLQPGPSGRHGISSICSRSCRQLSQDGVHFTDTRFDLIFNRGLQHGKYSQFISRSNHVITPHVLNFFITVTSTAFSQKFASHRFIEVISHKIRQKG